MMASWQAQFANFISYCQQPNDDANPSEAGIAARYLELEQQLSGTIDAVDLRAQLPSPILEAIVEAQGLRSYKQHPNAAALNTPDAASKNNAAGILTGDLNRVVDMAKIENNETDAKTATHECAQLAPPPDVNHNHEELTLDEIRVHTGNEYGPQMPRGSPPSQSNMGRGATTTGESLTGSDASNFFSRRAVHPANFSLQPSQRFRLPLPSDSGFYRDEDQDVDSND
ncbi:hypothetical protein CSUB01_10800 [Colletotrichum sublineola]|uniref:Uncharacterized protein n=1 Tax=Colletotrichum sublineola TaxID=1173701 RepID=A0A066XQ46_COLSU|nr:hypothetical protein CSUB01_10800 [Colletotrichum sublineola]